MITDTSNNVLKSFLNCYLVSRNPRSRMEHVIAVPSSPAAAPAVAPAFISSGDGPLLPIGGRPLSTVPAPDGSGARTLRGLPPALPPPPPAPYAFRETAERFLEKSKQQTLEMKARGEAALAAQASRFDGVMKDTVAHFVAQISVLSIDFRFFFKET